MRASLIITAAGSGARFNKSFASAVSPQPAKAHFASALQSKLFFDLGGISVLERTLRAFAGIPQIQETLVTVSSGARREVAAWAKSRKLKKIHWVEGGKTRAGSVLQALRKTSPQNEWVMVHDGARPLIRAQTVTELLKQAAQHDGILLARRVTSTLKKISMAGDRTEATVDRAHLAEAETPQVVRRQVLLDAYERVPDALNFTDESGLVEAAGGKMGIFLHTDWNPKLTHYADYQLMSGLCAAGATGTDNLRIGKGYDIHRLVAGRKLWIGGLLIPCDKGSLGHSDGDALLHSITDAILGALGWGDIGDWFSDKKSKYKNIRSEKLLTQVLEKAAAAGWVPAQADTNIILEKPRLGPAKKKIRESVAKFLKLPVDRVSVKGRTYEGLPPFGTGEAWACEAIVMLKRTA